MARTLQRIANPNHSNATLASSGSPQPVMIQANNLTKRYGHNLVVDDITFSVNVGENVVLLGSSGSGKTTLLKILNRLVEPTSGTVHLNGTFTLDFPPHELRRLIGYVSQQSGLLPHMTVRENMGITPKLLGWPREKIDTRNTLILKRKINNRWRQTDKIQ